MDCPPRPLSVILGARTPHVKMFTLQNVYIFKNFGARSGRPARSKASLTIVSKCGFMSCLLLGKGSSKNSGKSSSLNGKPCGNSKLGNLTCLGLLRGPSSAGLGALEAGSEGEYNLGTDLVGPSLGFPRLSPTVGLFRGAVASLSERVAAFGGFSPL